LIRFLIFLLKIIALVVAAVWVADRAGKITLEWQDNVIETSAALVIGIIALLIVLAYNAARIIAELRNTPRLYRMHTHLRHQRLGQKMLSDALGAFAEHKKGQGIKFLRKAEKLLGPSQVVNLVKTHVGQPADQALASLPLNKKSRFADEVRQKNWDAAGALLEQMRLAHSMPRKDWRDTKAALLTERARDALEHNHAAQAFEWAMQADRLRPNWVPARLMAVRALAKQDKAKEASTLIERTWGACAHEQLGDAYLALRTGRSDLQKAQGVEKFTKDHLANPASRLLLARALAKAGLWGQARSYTKALAQEQPRRDYYDLLAHIEDVETQDKHAVAQWKNLAVSSAPDEAWLCNNCKQPHGEWQGNCASCHGFNTLNWGIPLHKQSVGK